MKEIWKEIPNTNGFYHASNLGRIKSIERAIIHPKSGKQIIKSTLLAMTLSNRGYFYISICINGKRRKSNVHELVCSAFYGEKPKGFHIDHINRIRTDNRVENLRYVTVFENCSFPGSTSANAKLTEEQVLEIRAKYIPKIYTLKMLAKEYGVDMTCIGHIIKRRLWKHI